ncbi:GNAT family N-acetyltransferase [Glutamicibacter endophyticus]|uniref:GNAT family N-acetyltransferase n=1 Tax=Glutamicibacter endophyticus TaxID=1522174 RepID=UPI003AF1A386
MNFQLRRATMYDVPSAAATLADAFDSYPWTRWSIPADDYLARLERLQAIYLSHAIEHGLVLISYDHDGVAALLPPDCPEPDTQRQEEIAELMGERLEIVFGVQLPARPENSWELATLGVAKSSAGRGLGSALLRKSLWSVATSPFPRVSLETSAAQNVRLYQRHGFVLSQCTDIAEGPRVYSMRAELTDHRRLGV